MSPAIRGTCPGISTPMPTGDGLLARLIPREPIAVDTFISLCAAAREYGNGVVEVTQRGNLQIRGLQDASAPAFARAVTSLGIGQGNGPPILTSPLLGLGARQTIDLRAVVAALGTALSDRSDLAALGPKVTVLIDDGGELHLDDVPADIRLRAAPDGRLELAIGGDARTSFHAGWVESGQVVPVVTDILARIASRGPTTRARDLRGELQISARDAPDVSRPPAEPIGLHPLKDSQFARGFALAFGHTTAAALQRLARAVADHGGTSIRPAPGRALLAIGMSRARADEFCETASVEGFVVEPNDPRRNVVACAGSPACVSATLPTRQLAPEIARAARSFLGGALLVHLSGCSKGCAHPGPAALTIVGPDQFVLGGRAGDPPRGTISPAGLIADIGRLCAEIHCD